MDSARLQGEKRLQGKEEKRLEGAGNKEVNKKAVGNKEEHGQSMKSNETATLSSRMWNGFHSKDLFIVHRLRRHQRHQRLVSGWHC